VDPTLALVLGVCGGVVVVAIGVAVAVAWWRRGAVDRARTAALETFTPFARRFGVAVAPGDRGALPWLQLAGPRGVLVTVSAEIVPDGTLMNDEPGAWVRKTLVALAWIAGSAVVVVVVVVLALGGPSVSTTPVRTGPSVGSSGVRRTAVAVPLPPVWQGIELEAKHGVFKRLWAALFGSWVPTGDAAFDAAFWIKAPPQQLQWALTPSVRAALLAFRAQHGRFAIAGGRLVWSRRTYATEGLDAVLDGFARLAPALG
jgi:hypothetical protein